MTPKSKARPAAQASSGSPVQLELFESKPAQDESPLPDADEPFELTPLSEFDGTAMKMGRHRLETLELARELYARGASYKTVAASLHVSVYAARDWMHQFRNGTFDELLNPQLSAPMRYGEGIKRRVLHLRAKEGLSYNKIVALTGVSRATIRKWLANASAGCPQLDNNEESRRQGDGRRPAAPDATDLLQG